MPKEAYERGTGMINQEDYNNQTQRQAHPENEFDSSNRDGVNGKGNHPKKGGGNFLKIAIIAVITGLALGGINEGVKRISTGISSKKQADLEGNIVFDKKDELEKKDEETYSGVSQIVENVKPAIVAITSTMKEVTYNIFGRPSVEQASGAGSGIIIAESGNSLLIATNNHVIEGASSIVIEFIDGTTAEGTVKGAEAGSDLAVVSVPLKNLTAETKDKIRVATLGNSEKCQPGELVVAIGNALGYGQSTTVGYISALNREIELESKTLTLLQTDAAINPGNSGGALINARGEVIGINSVKFVKTEIEGIGYAIPISSAIPIMNELMNREELSSNEQGYLGIIGKDVTKEEAKAWNLPEGVYVNDVVDGSAAKKAGLKQTDIIVGIAGRSIKTMQELQSYLEHTRVGTNVTVQLKVRENGAYVDKEVEVTLGQKR